MKRPPEKNGLYIKKSYKTTENSPGDLNALTRIINGSLSKVSSCNSSEPSSYSYLSSISNKSGLKVKTFQFVKVHSFLCSQKPLTACSNFMAKKQSLTSEQVTAEIAQPFQLSFLKFDYYLTLSAPTPQNGQIRSNDSSAKADELFERV